MQEKTNNSVETKAYRRYTTAEERLAYVKKWQESGLKVTEYCKQQNIALSSFIGWRHAVTKPGSLFKPVIANLITPAMKAKSGNIGNVIEIMTGSAIRIRLVNVVDASPVVNIAR